MAEDSKISWTDHTANFWWGCERVSALCDHCYAADLDKRYGGDNWGLHNPRKFIKTIWNNIQKWDTKAAKEGVKKRVFAMSMGDIFERLPENHPDFQELEDVRYRALFNMELLTNLEWLVLTKRIPNVVNMIPNNWLSKWPPNIRLGISVGTQKEYDRDVPRLLKIDCPNFLSMEPLLESVDIDFYSHGLDWVITGGESGPNARAAHPDWYRQIRDECIASSIPFHFKQHGEWLHDTQVTSEGINVGHIDRVHKWPDGSQSLWIGKYKAGHLLDGKEWLQFP